ncbi:MAG: hypothetical protein SVV03_06035 [Candidatus Nanohaloarchaea archaeon]|nr:hypothetical protein [Candidatus Nanohaloarchaea archaeon]
MKDHTDLREEPLQSRLRKHVVESAYNQALEEQIDSLDRKDSLDSKECFAAYSTEVDGTRIYLYTLSTGRDLEGPRYNSWGIYSRFSDLMAEEALENGDRVVVEDKEDLYTQVLLSLSPEIGDDSKENQRKNELSEDDVLSGLMEDEEEDLEKLEDVDIVSYSENTGQIESADIRGMIEGAAGDLHIVASPRKYAEVKEGIKKYRTGFYQEKLYEKESEAEYWTRKGFQLAGVSVVAVGAGVVSEMLEFPVDPDYFYSLYSLSFPMTLASIFTASKKAHDSVKLEEKLE